MSKPRNQIQEYCNSSAVSKRVLAGNACLVSFPETSQLINEGTSSCALAAFNFARIGFRIEQSCADLPDILDKLATKEVIEDVATVCTGWSSLQPLNEDDIRCLPIFERSLQLVSVEYGGPEPKQFQRLLGKMHQLEKSAVVIITRPPEVIACFKFSTATRFRSTTYSDPVFAVFDPHPRPSHPRGTGVMFSTSIEQTSRTLCDIMLSLDEGYFDSSEQTFSGHLFVGKTTDGDPEEYLIQSSLAILSLRAQLSALEGQIKTLSFENQQLRSEADHLKSCIGREQIRSKEGPAPTRPSPLTREPPCSFNTSNHSITGPIRASHSLNDVQSPGTSVRFVDDAPNPTRGVISSCRPRRLTADSERQSDVALNITDNSSPGSAGNSNDTVLFRDPLYASLPSYTFSRIPGAFDVSDDDTPPDSDPFQPRNAIVRSRQPEQSGGALSIFADNASLIAAGTPIELTYGLDDSPTHDDDGVYTLPDIVAQSRLHDLTHRPSPQPGGALSIFTGTPSPPPTTNPPVDSDSGSEIDEGIEIDELWIQNALKPRFTCGICLDEHLQESGVLVEECSHMVCNGCFKDFICSNIQARRFPVFCPICMADQVDGTRPSVISTLMVERLDVTEHQFQIWTEMELSEFFVQIHCRQCNRPSFVDRQDYLQASKILCPHVDCINVWCKNCDQTINSGGPKHSCDGSSELDHLIKQMAWQRCPNCKTPVQKISGCNSMRCIVPSCNAAFCYRCGRANHAC